MCDVGSRKLFENDKVVVWEFTLEPGEITGVHTHSRDYLIHALKGAPAEVFDKDLKSLGTGELHSGDTLYLRLEGGELVSDVIRLPATHAARNIGRNRYREILIEIK